MWLGKDIAMRWLAWLLTPVAFAASAWAALELYRVVKDPVPVLQQSAAATEPDEEIVVAEPQPPTTWPSLFGEVTAPEPQPPAPTPTPEVIADEPQPPRPPAPPIESLGFSLRGIVSDGGTRWAIVSHPTGDRLLRKGDLLALGVTVTEIEPGGLTLDNNGEAAFLAFTD